MANFNLNKTQLAGRLTATPELKTTPSGLSVTQFTIAVDRKSKSEEAKADFFPVTAWRGTAELVCKYLTKGSSVYVEGYLQTRNYEKDGQKHYVTEVVAESVIFVDSKSENPNTTSRNQSNSGESGVGGINTSANSNAPKTAFETPVGEYPAGTTLETVEDDELPF